MRREGYQSLLWSVWLVAAGMEGVDPAIGFLEAYTPRMRVLPAKFELLVILVLRGGFSLTRV